MLKVSNIQNSFKHARVISNLYSYLSFIQYYFLYKVSVAESTLIDHVGVSISVYEGEFSRKEHFVKFSLPPPPYLKQIMSFNMSS